MSLLPRHRSVFLPWLLSYSVIVLILVALSAAVYLGARRILIDEINQAKGATLRQAAQAIGSRLADVERLKRQASLNPRVTSFMYLKAPLDLADRYALIMLGRDLVIYKASHTFVDSLYVFFHDSDIVLSSETVCGSALFHRLYVEEDLPSYRDWLSLVRGNHDGDFVRVGDSIVYLQALPPDLHMPISATLAIRLDRGWLTSTLGSLAWDADESVLVLDRSDHVIAAAGRGSAPAGLRYQDLREGATLRLPAGPGEPTLLVSTAAAPVADWKIASVVPEAALTRRVTHLQNLTILGLLACLAAGGAVAYRSARRNTSRISEVASEMAALAGIPRDGGDEYQVLRAAVAATLEQRRRVDSSLRQYNGAMKQNFVRRLVRGRFAGVAEVEESLADFGVAPYSPYYAVFIVYVEGSPAVEQDRQGGQRLASLILSHAFEGIIERRHRGLVAEVDDMMACVVNLRLLSVTEWNRDLLLMAEECRRQLAERFGIESTVGLSAVHSDVGSVPQCYQEALDALEHKLVVGPGRIIRFEEISERRSTYLCPIETEQQLLNALRVGDAARAGGVVDDIFERNFAAGEPSVASLKCFVFDVYNLLLQAAAGTDEGRQRPLEDLAQPLLSVLSGTRDLAELRQRVREIVVAVARTMANLKKDDRLALEIKEFVRGAYGDLNLSISMIADRFGLSQGYISRLFKEMTGESLLDHIGRTRVARAKELLDERKAPLAQVASLVGYTSATALIRAFKKHQGITPGQYRTLD